jgi:hypothetical protein
MLSNRSRARWIGSSTRGLLGAPTNMKLSLSNVEPVSLLLLSDLRVLRPVPDSTPAFRSDSHSAKHNVQNQLPRR